MSSESQADSDDRDALIRTLVQKVERLEQDRASDKGKIRALEREHLRFRLERKGVEFREDGQSLGGPDGEASGSAERRPESVSNPAPMPRDDDSKPITRGELASLLREVVESSRAPGPQASETRPDPAPAPPAKVIAESPPPSAATREPARDAQLPGGFAAPRSAGALTYPQTQSEWKKLPHAARVALADDPGFDYTKLRLG